MSRIDDINHIDNIDNGETNHELYGFLVDHVLEFRSCFFQQHEQGIHFQQMTHSIEVGCEETAQTFPMSC